eukprot:gene23773-64514_t
MWSERRTDRIDHIDVKAKCTIEGTDAEKGAIVQIVPNLATCLEDLSADFRVPPDLVEELADERPAP